MTRSWSLAFLLLLLALPAARAIAVPCRVLSDPEPCAGVRLSEFLPYPPGGEDWIELENSGFSPCDLSGWQLDSAEDGQPAYAIQSAEPFAAGAFRVFYRSTTGVSLGDESGAVLLLRPDGGLVDSYRYGSARLGWSYARDGLGSWQETSCLSPGRPNRFCTPTALPSSTSTSTATIVGTHAPSLTGTPNPTPSPSATSTSQPISSPAATPAATATLAPSAIPTPTYAASAAPAETSTATTTPVSASPTATQGAGSPYYVTLPLALANSAE